MNFEEAMQVTRNISSDQMLHDDEAELLFNSVSEVPAGGIAIETGCQLGRSSTLIAQVAKANQFHSIHIDPHTAQREWAMAWVGNMMQAQGDWEHEFTALFMRTDQSDWLLSKLAPFDFAYIDGDHNYPGVMVDLELIAERIKIGGIMCAHDYGESSLPDVYRAMSKYMETRSENWELIAHVRAMGAWRRIR